MPMQIFHHSVHSSHSIQSRSAVPHNYRGIKLSSYAVVEIKKSCLRTVRVLEFAFKLNMQLRLGLKSTCDTRSPLTSFLQLYQCVYFLQLAYLLPYFVSSVCTFARVTWSILQGALFREYRILYCGRFITVWPLYQTINIFARVMQMPSWKQSFFSFFFLLETVSLLLPAFFLGRDLRNYMQPFS